MRRIGKIVVAFIALIAPAAANSDSSSVQTLPALSREWHSAEYQTIARAIDTGAIPLPRFSDTQGQVLLRKITSVDSLALAQDKGLPIETRLQEMMSLLSATRLIAKPYIARAAKGEKVNAETAAIVAFLLRIAGAGQKVLIDYLPTIPHDTRYAARMDGLKMVRSGYTNMIFGAATSVSERAFYSPDDVSVMLSAIADTLHVLKSNLADDARAELARKLDEERKFMSKPSDIHNLDRALAELRS
jgi:hypothetical protein